MLLGCSATTATRTAAVERGALVSGPGHGTLTLNANGSFIYTPAAHYDGTDSFTYRANDGTLDSNQAKVTITITATNEEPTAADDTCSTTEDTALTVGTRSCWAMTPTRPRLIDRRAGIGTSHGTLTLNATARSPTGRTTTSMAATPSPTRPTTEPWIPTSAP